MLNEDSNVVCEEQTEFKPIALVRNTDRLLGKSVILDLLVGKQVTIDPESEHNFQIAGQPRKSFRVTTLDKKHSYQIATNLLSTKCLQTSRMFGIKLLV